MTRSNGRRIGALAGILLMGMAVLASAGPASAQGTLRFSANCELPNMGAAVTGGLVDVPAGTSINGAAAVATRTTVTGPATVTYPNGSVASLNVVSTVGSTTTRQAIVITAGPGAGTVVGQAVCTPTSATASALVGSAVSTACPPIQNLASGVASSNGVTVGYPAGARCDMLGVLSRASADGEYAIAGLPYPLAVGVAAPAAANTDLASQPASSGGQGGLPLTALLIGGAVAVAVAAQVAIGQRVKRQRADVPIG